MKLTAYPPFTFSVAARATQAHVLVRAAGGEAVRLAGMQRAGYRRWEVRLQLPPGTYSYRFYLDVEGVTVVEPGWSATPAARRDGLDAVIEIPSTRPSPTESTERLPREVLHHV